LRILITGQSYAPAPNGQAVFTTQLAEGLAKDGHEITVVVPSFRSKASRSRIEGVGIHRLSSFPVGRQLQDAHLTVFPWIELREIFGHSNPHVVHMQDHYPLSRWVFAMARNRSLPVMGTNHFLPDNVIHYIWPFQRGRSIVERLLWWTVTSLYRRADLVTTPTGTAARILAPHLSPGPPIRAISCGVDFSRYSKVSPVNHAGPRLKYGLPTDKPLLVYVGRIDQEKDLHVLLRAIRIVESPVHLAVVGAGRWESKLREISSSLGLQHQVTFTGYVREDELPSLLQAADLFVMPSPAELQSIATLEAMAAGKPIIAARARALPELVEDDVNGLLFEPGSHFKLASAIRQLLGNSGRWSQMGNASRIKVMPHSISNVVREYSGAYRQLIRARYPVPGVLTAEEGARLEP
jgi:glycosyltransferase involved in cell wall biosynthesis